MGCTLKSICCYSISFIPNSNQKRFYILCWTISWFQKHDEYFQINLSYICRHHRPAKIMMMFVVAFFIQWICPTVYGIWPFVFKSALPTLLVYLVGILTNLGGLLNAAVYVIIRKGGENERPNYYFDQQTYSAVRFRTHFETNRQEGDLNLPPRCDVQQHDSHRPYLETHL